MSMIDSAIVYFLQGRFFEGLGRYSKIPPLDEIKRDSAAVAHVLSRRAFLGYYRRDFTQALDDCKNSLALLDATKDQAQIAFTLATMGMIYRAQKDYALALECHHKSLAVCEALGDRSLAAIPLYNIGVVYHEQHQQDLALKYYQQSLAISQELGLKPLTHYVLYDIGSALFFQSKYSEAVGYYRQSLALREALGNKAEIALALSAIADAYKLLHDDESALRYYQRSLALCEPLGGPESTLVMQMIGGIYINQKNYRRALEYLHRSLANARASNDKSKVAEDLVYIGAVQGAQANYDSSLEYYRQGLAVYETLGSSDSVAETLMYIGDAYRLQNKYDLAIQSYQRAADLAGAIGSKKLAGDGLFRVGEAYLSRGDNSQASAYGEKCLAVAESIGDKRLIAHALYLLGIVRYFERQYAEALKFLERSGRVVTELGNLTESGDLITAFARALAGKAYGALQQFGPARRALDEAIAMLEADRVQVVGGEQDRERFLEDKVWPFHAAVDLFVTQNKPDEALAYAERAKARTLLDVLTGGRVNVNKAMTPDEQERERSINNRIISLNEQIIGASSGIRPDKAGLADLRVSLQKARRDREEFEASLYAAHPELKPKRRGAQPFKLEDASGLLTDAKTALLEYVVDEDQTFLFVLTKGGQQSRAAMDVRVFTIRIQRKELASRAEEFRRQLAEHDLDFHASATQLYQLLLGPAQTLLEGKTNLIIVPDEALWQLPFQALQPRADRYLIEDAAICYSPSLSVLREMLRLHDKPNNAILPPSHLLALGNPAIGRDVAQQVKIARRDERLEPLPETEAEVKALAEIYGPEHSRVYIGAQATEERLKAEAGDYDVLHVAAHAVLDNASPMYSHIVLAQPEGRENEDGLLEAWEIMNLDLRATLVVLSACETARGRVATGEGVIGMMWALFVAGCPTTVVSQWKVDSASTTELMVEFHRNLNSKNANGQARMTKAESLRQAALKLMKQSNYRHPLYWAGFIIVGDGF
jgi:CHAT domain-containing protein/uncharacterized protein HemY